MASKFIVDVLRNIEEQESALGSLTFDRQAPHYLKDGLEPLRPRWRLSGVYLLTKPQVPDWRVPLEESNAELWYIGMTTANLFDRIDQHFGRPATGDAASYRHRWANVAMPTDISKCLATGEVVVYPIGVSLGPTSLTESQRYLLPSVVEKKLLVAYVDRFGALPPLNLSM